MVSAVAPLRAYRFRALLVGQGVSALGDWMGTFAFMTLALQESASPTAVGGILALRLIPATIGGPLAVRAAGRWDRRRTMVTMDIVRAGMIAAVPIVRGLWWIYLWAFLIEVASLVFLPARDASIPDLVDADSLPVANGFILGSSYGTIPLGAGLFALIAALPHTVLGRPYATAFWVDAATYLVSAVLIGSITGLGGKTAAAADAGAESARATPKLRDAISLPLVRAVMPATAAVAVGLGALFSLGIVFVRDELHAGDAQFGALVALFGVGAIAGLGALQTRTDRDLLADTRRGALALGGIVMGFSLAPSLVLAFLGAAAFGGAAAWTLASGMGLLQSSLDGQMRVVAFALFHVVIRSALALAAIGAGAAGEFASKVRLPLLGELAPSRLVLLCSGAVVALSASQIRIDPGRPSPTRELE